MKPCAALSLEQSSRRPGIENQAGGWPMLEIDQREPLASPERHLWGAVLALLLQDAMAYHKRPRPKQYERREAYRDVLSCGERLRWCCDHTGHDAEGIAEAFARWVERRA